MVKADVYLKLEGLQRTGSFEIRGAYTKLFKMAPSDRSKGIVAGSAGNHAQGVAYAAALLGVPCTVVMPESASPAKVTATREQGARIVLHGKTFDEALAKAKEIAAETQSRLIHAFEDIDIIAGQGSVGLEIIEALPDVDTVVAPVGGGGLISGVALALKNRNPKIRIIGVQSEAFPSMLTALESRKPVSLSPGDSFADGIAVKEVGETTLQIASQLVDNFVTVNDAEIGRTMFLLLDRIKIVAEPAGAAALAALISGKVKEAGKKIVAIISGGNVDMFLLNQIVARGLSELNRLVRLSFEVPDKPGALIGLLATVAEAQVNVVDVQHDRLNSRISMGKVHVTLSLETRDENHTKELTRALSEKGIRYSVTV